MNTEVQDSVLSVLAGYAAAPILSCEQAFSVNLTEIVNDSLSLIEVVYELEDRFRITLAAECLTQLHTVDDLIQAIDQQVSKQPH